MEHPGFAKTSRLFQLFQVAPEERNPQWLAEFYATIPEAALRFSSEEQVEFGPDGLPYARLGLPIPGEPFNPVTMVELLPWITDSGIGVVFNEVDGNPWWVFPYGQMWTLREFGQFELPAPDQQQQSGWDELSENSQMTIGQPSDEYLPPYVRQAIRRFIVEGLGKDEPQVVLICPVDSPQALTLVLSVFPEDYPDEQRYTSIMHLIRWYLPTSYQLAGIPKDSPIAQHFQPLIRE
jgi:hypothetical protein